jgi:hypothetical protein
MSARRLLPLILLVGFPLGARAQEPPSLAERAPERASYESPQHFWFEFKLGPYVPGIDSEFGGKASPYHELFDGRDATDPTKVVGDGKNLIFSWELDYEILRRFGTLAVGGAIGYFTNTAKALVNEDPTSIPLPSGARSGSDSTIMMLPFSALVVYRFDLLADRYKVPLVPYVKLGLNYPLWWMLLDGDVRQYTKADGTVVSAKGGTFGWQVNAGLAFRLDVLDPGAARALDSEIGINHTYLFFELTHLAADGLGSGAALRLGDTSYSGGLAFEF